MTSARLSRLHQSNISARGGGDGPPPTLRARRPAGARRFRKRPCRAASSCSPWPRWRCRAAASLHRRRRRYRRKSQIWIAPGCRFSRRSLVFHARRKCRASAPCGAHDFGPARTRRSSAGDCIRSRSGLTRWPGRKVRSHFQRMDPANRRIFQGHSGARRYGARRSFRTGSEIEYRKGTNPRRRAHDRWCRRQ